MLCVFSSYLNNYSFEGGYLQCFLLLQMRLPSVLHNLYAHLCFQGIPERVALSKGRCMLIFIKDYQPVALPILTFQWGWAVFSSAFGVGSDLVAGSKWRRVSEVRLLVLLEDLWCWTPLSYGHLGIWFFIRWLVCCV